MRIAIVYNARPENLDRHDPQFEQTIEGDEWKTIYAIGDAFSSLGHTASYFPIDATIYHRLEAAKENIDLIFNFAEGIRGADREAQIPMLAEILGIPYTGPGPLASALILNKSKAKEIWLAHGLSTASYQVVDSPTFSLSKHLHFPLIVKPNNEGSGIGIKHNSIVHTPSELKIAVNNILSLYRQSALVETYLPGREFTVGLIGNGDDLLTLPIIEINFAALPQGAPAIDSFEAKFVYGATGAAPMHETEFCPAPVTKPLGKKIIQLAKDAYTTIGCCDFGRVDIRLDAKGAPHVLEINHPPGLMSDPEESSFFTIAGRAAGYDFPTLMGKIINSARKRLNL